MNAEQKRLLAAPFDRRKSPAHDQEDLLGGVLDVGRMDPETTEQTPEPGKVRVSDRREAGLSCGIQSHGPLGMLKGALEARGDHHSS